MANFGLGQCPEILERSPPFILLKGKIIMKRKFVAIFEEGAHNHPFVLLFGQINNWPNAFSLFCWWIKYLTGGGMENGCRPTTCYFSLPSFPFFKFTFFFCLILNCPKMTTVPKTFVFSIFSFSIFSHFISFCLFSVFASKANSFSILLIEKKKIYPLFFCFVPKFYIWFLILFERVNFRLSQ